MPDLELDIKQLADNGGTEPFAPITVSEAVMFSNGDSLSDKIGNTDISSIGNGSITSAINSLNEKVASSESGSWTIRKSADGIVECWGELTTESITVSLVNNWYCGTAALSLPSNLFTSAPKIFINCVSFGTGYHWGFAYAITKNGFRIAVNRNDNASGPATVQVFAIGKWK